MRGRLAVRFFVSRWDAMGCDEVARLRPWEDIYVQKGQEREGVRRAFIFCRYLALLVYSCFWDGYGIGWDGIRQGRAQQDRRIDGWMDGWIGDQSLSESLNYSFPRSV